MNPDARARNPVRSACLPVILLALVPSCDLEPDWPSEPAAPEVPSELCGSWHGTFYGAITYPDGHSKPYQAPCTVDTWIDGGRLMQEFEGVPPWTTMPTSLTGYGYLDPYDESPVEVTWQFTASYRSGVLENQADFDCCYDFASDSIYAEGMFRMIVRGPSGGMVTVPGSFALERSVPR